MLLFGIKKDGKQEQISLMAENCNIMLLKKYGTQELTFQNMIVLFAMDY